MLINSTNVMKGGAHGTQQPRHINRIGEGVSTAQRSNSLVQSINQRFPKISDADSTACDGAIFLFQNTHAQSLSKSIQRSYLQACHFFTSGFQFCSEILYFDMRNGGQCIRELKITIPSIVSDTIDWINRHDGNPHSICTVHMVRLKSPNSIMSMTANPFVLCRT